MDRFVNLDPGYSRVRLLRDLKIIMAFCMSS